MYKLLCSLFICTLCALNSYAQNLSVRIKSGEENLPFSYVLINGKYHSAADSTGRAAIPINLLKTGDTISARYVGAQEAFCVFDGQDELELNLPGLEIGSIVVLPKEKRKNIWRNINRHKVRKAYHKITCRFEIYKNTDSAHVSSGRAKCWIYPKGRAYDIKGDIECVRNDANCSRPVLDVTKVIVNQAFVDVVFRTAVTTNKGIRILKENGADGMDAYTIIRPAVIGGELMNESTKIFVDPVTKDIVKTLAVSEYKTFSMVYTASYRVIDDYYIPFCIECTITYREGDPRMLNYRIFDLHLNTKRDKQAVKALDAASDASGSVPGKRLSSGLRISV